MKIYRAGETSHAICAHCKALVPTTFAYRDVPFEDGAGIVRGILAAVCDRCGLVVAIPAQSTPAIRRARAVAEVALEVVLPAPELELLDLAIWRIDPEAGQRLRKSLLAFYLARFASEPQGADRLRTLIEAAETARHPAGLPRKRLSCKISHRTDAVLRDMAAGLKASRTQIVRGLIREIDLRLVRPDVPEDLETLRQAAALVAA